jgi:hypothetical protein
MKSSGLLPANATYSCCAKYNMEIFTPAEIEAGIDKLCAGGRNNNGKKL